MLKDAFRDLVLHHMRSHRYHRFLWAVTAKVRIPGHKHSVHCLLICLPPPSVSFLGFFSSCVFFPLISSQDMSNSLQSQTELFTSSTWDHRSLKHTFCRITQIFACLLHSRNELWESNPVRFLAFHGFYQVRKKHQSACFMKYFYFWRTKLYRSL